MNKENQEKPKNESVDGLDFMANLMDNQFKIPGTNIRFGLDSLLGFIPGVGDAMGLMVSGYLVSVMAKRGAGPILMLQMLGNIALDATVGAIPILGDLFDLGFKANRRNVDLLKKYYATDKKRPPAKWSFGFLMLIFVAFLAFIFWAMFQISRYAYHLIFG